MVTAANVEGVLIRVQYTIAEGMQESAGIAAMQKICDLMCCRL